MRGQAVIYVLHGSDTYSQRRFLDALREAVGPPQIRDPNVTVLDVREATPAAIVGLSSTMPFLAERRLVLVEGLLASVEGGGRRAGRGASGAMAQWEGIGSRLEAIAPSTDLVFSDGALRAGNPLLRELSKVAEVRAFSPPFGEDLHRWIRSEATDRGGSFAPAAVQRLAEMVGPDLWLLSGEIEKLVLYAAGRDVQPEDVGELVSLARDASVFTAVDAVLAGDRGRALRMVHRLLQGDATVSYLLAMLGRQVRLILLAQELIRERTPQDELGKELGITSAYPLRKTMEQARATSPATARLLHAGLLEADVSIKTGALDERLALELLIGQACGQVRGRSASKTP